MSAKKVKIIEDKMPLWENSNPNKDIFIIPTQEGADEDDQGHGSIGDATMEHVYQQRHKLLELESFLCMPDGNIFRVEESPIAPDEANNRDLKKLLIFASTAPTSNRFKDSDKESLLAFLQEEIKRTEEALIEKQDALDNTVISFEDWADNPGLAKSVDIPSTPKPLFIYSGNCNQEFYDWFPEDHPDKTVINNLLSSIKNVDWDHWTEKTTNFFQDWLNYTNYNKQEKAWWGERHWNHPQAKEILTRMLYSIEISVDQKPEVIIIQALQELEEDWRSVVVSTYQEQRAKDPVFKELSELELMLKQKPGDLAWNMISKKGKSLYTKYKDKISTAHWNAYKLLKQRFAPPILVRNIDLNRANMNQLRAFFAERFKDTEQSGVSSKVEKLASFVFFNRPFMRLEDLGNKIAVEDVGYTENTVAFISLIKAAYKNSLKYSNIKFMSKLAQEIVDIQKADKSLCTEEEWASIWQAYRVAKNQLEGGIIKP